ncbi:TSL-kinase interacting protein 1-like isoform X2 [Chenopodium quinoa]|uniref:TSL-kinase interacting protein 1-like isoform X2 n=1 Tax=Chenopodium quinoa TaxID=63459 RepID=UPI000B777F31|nr:TSL-kinase interacting protein 1-like isoform X2 [Chenopodium quinoa]
MKSSKQPKEKAEQVAIQGSISKSPTGKRRVGKDVRSTVCRVLPQHGDCNAVNGPILGTVNPVSSDIQPANEIMLQPPKIVLQLFPINDRIRVGLEKDGHNPFLELTLSARKKISSVLKHLFKKWGCSSIAMGELMLFPFNVSPENLTSCTRWTSNDTGVSAGYVHALLGSPEIFRLRYGWVSFQPNSSPLHCTRLDHVENVRCHTMEDAFGTRNEVCETSKVLEPCNENDFTDLAVRQPVSSNTLHQVAHNNQDEVKSEDLKPISSRKIENDTRAEEDPSAEPFKHEEPKLDTNLSMTSPLWSDLSNISIGGLLSEISMQGRFSTEDPRSGGSRLVSQPTVADSLDAFIEQFKYPQSSTMSNSDMPSSILDAESTCHSFAFSKPSSSSKDLPPTPGRRAFSGLSGHNSASESFKCLKSEVNTQSDLLGSDNVQEPKTDPLPCSTGVFNNENSLGLSSIRWNDSLGPFDLPLASRQIIKDDNLSIGGFVR